MGPIESIAEQIQSLTLMEATDLLRRIEDMLAVSGSPPPYTFTIYDPIPDFGETDPPEYTVILLDAGDKKLNVIKEIRGVTTLGVMDAKALVESAPQVVRAACTKFDAERICRRLVEAGASVELRQIPMIVGNPPPEGRVAE